MSALGAQLLMATCVRLRLAALRRGRQAVSQRSTATSSRSPRARSRRPPPTARKASGGRYQIVINTPADATPTRSASSSCAAWPPRTARSTSSAWTSTGRRSSPRPAGSGRGPGAAAATVTNGVLAGPIATATWKGQLYGAPLNSNTQLLWYRKDLVPTPPTTWAQMIQDGRRAGQAGQAAPNRGAGRPVRGPTRLVQLAGRLGRRPDPERARAPSRSGRPRPQAATIMHDLASSPGRRPRRCPTTQEDQGRLGFEEGDGGVRDQLPVRLSERSAGRSQAGQGHGLGAVPARDRRPARAGHDRRHQPRRLGLLRASRRGLRRDRVPGQPPAPDRRRGQGRPAARRWRRCTTIRRWPRRIRSTQLIKQQLGGPRDPAADAGLLRRVAGHPEGALAARARSIRRRS